jgi:ubiquinone/menaquinone biosynthesis C-methylase UbiE
MRTILSALVVVPLLLTELFAQQTSLTDAQIAQAKAELPRFVELLELKAGMAVADVGAGFGAWTMEFSRFIGPSGRVYATDVGPAQLTSLRASVARESLANVIVLEGAPQSTNLPEGCCDAILIRDVYHHLTHPDEIVRSMAAALKPGGRLAVIDFPPAPGSAVPAGVAANRGGHGVPQDVVLREVSAVLVHVRTISKWSDSGQDLYLLLFRKP